MADILQIKRMLADRAPAVAEMLLPGGKRDGHEWRAGSVAGEPGKSLGVHLTGPKAGTWCDFHGGEDRGDLLDLWRLCRGLTLPQALDDARSWLGVERPEPYRTPRREYTRPPVPKSQPPKNRVRDYLVEDRNIPAEVLDRYKIGEMGDDILFPFYLPDGALALAKRRKAVDGAKPVPTAKDCEPVLFGWQAIPDDARSIVLTEGEIDTLAMAAYGHHALSVPFGGGGGAKQQWIENEYDRLDRFENIYLAMDMDEPGEQAAEAIADRLGRHRCARVMLPRKDAGECIVDGVSASEIDAAVKGAKGLDPDGLRRPSEMTDNVVGLFWPTPGRHVGYTTPYGKIQNKLLFRPSEVTIWTGESGSGKSQVLSDCTCDWVEQGSRVCVASLEMRGEQTLKRKVKQVVGVDRPTERAIVEALRWLDQGVLLYDHVGKEGVEGLLSVFDYARAKYGCDQFIIDSLMRLGIAGDDYVGQEKAVFRIVDWAINSNVHLHLVAHARKADKHRSTVIGDDIKGASEIANNAFNIITIRRNRDHEEKLRKAESDEERATINEMPGVVLNVWKQRNGDFEGTCGLWFDHDSYRYRSSSDRKTDRRYLRNIDLVSGAA